MDIFDSPQAFQEHSLRWRGEGHSVALVPTMGALHEGHFHLINEARRRADRLSVSIFVNPMQFGPNEDLDKYPRTFEADCEGCRRCGVDAIFAPRPEQMYPAEFFTHVDVSQLTEALCGASRPGHFRGVTTVVMKLLMLAQPTCAIFGWKDAQQFLVLRRMVADLAVPVEMVGVETVREPDGLALSSRNRYLSPGERAAAPLIQQGLAAAREQAAAGETNVPALLETVRAHVGRSDLFRIDYLQARRMDTMEELQTLAPGNTLLAIAAYLGATRLIDNVRL